MREKKNNISRLQKNTKEMESIRNWVDLQDEKDPFMRKIKTITEESEAEIDEAIDQFIEDTSSSFSSFWAAADPEGTQETRRRELPQEIS